MLNTLAANDSVVMALQDAVAHGGRRLDDIPGLLKRVIEEQCWVEREVRRTREVVRFPEFVVFVQSGPPEGLGTDLASLKRWCRDYLDVLDLIDKATIGQHGGDHGNQYTGGKMDNVQLDTPPTGNSRQRAIHRLRDARPDLHAQVIAGDLTPHAAMVEAGFRHQTATVPLDDMATLAAYLRRKLTPEQLVALREALS